MHRDSRRFVQEAVALSCSLRSLKATHSCFGALFYPSNAAILADVIVRGRSQGFYKCDRLVHIMIVRHAIIRPSDNELHMSSMHRSVPVERLEHRFYEPLLFLWMLNPAIGPTCEQSTINQPTSDFFSQWREFVDCLSWMCDFDHGGKTISTLAAEQTVDAIRFWLSFKHEVALPHLGDILEKLQLVSSATLSNLVATARTLAESSIQLSDDKVKNYCREFNPED